MIKNKKRGSCVTCRFNDDLFCTVGSYYAQKGYCVLCYSGELWEPLNSRTTADIRFRWLKAISTQISKLTSYIRKRCVKLLGLK